MDAIARRGLLIVLGLVWSLVVGLVIGSAAGCAGPARQSDSFLGDTHARDRRGTGGGAAAAMSAAEAEAALAGALAQGEPTLVVVLANRVLVAGGTLDAELRAGVAAAVDQAGTVGLEAAYRELDPLLYPAELVAFRLALVAAHTGEDGAARRWLKRSAGAEVPAERARALDELLSARARVDARTIAVLLPRSGRYAQLGTELEAGIRVAAARASAARLVFLDTRGDERGAEAAVDQAMFAHHAVAVLGPVGQRESLAAARRAAELGIPIALLSPSSGPEPGAAPDAGVVRLWSSPAWEASEAVRLAVAMSYDRLAVLAPRDELGAEAMRAFIAAARAAGVPVVAQGTYDPTGSALEPDIKAFLGLEPSKNERLRRHLARTGKSGLKTFSPDVSFDFLYIPDDHERAALVASYLPYFNIEVRSRDLMDVLYLKRKHGGRVPQVVQLMGSSGWHHESLIPRGGAAVDGALILDVYAGGENEPFASEDAALFAEELALATGRMPTSLSAQAHDAAALLIGVVDGLAVGRTGEPGPAGPPRAAFLRALLGAEVSGACGPARIGPGSSLEREAVLLRVDGGSFALHEY